jgi:hypothetical protein
MERPTTMLVVRACTGVIGQADMMDPWLELPG